MFSFAFLTLDLIIIIAIFIACLFIAFVKGEHILARFLLAFYPTTLFYLYLPFISLKTPMTEVAVFIFIYAAMIFLLKRNFTTGRSYKKSKRFIDCGILALGSLVTIMTIYYHIIPLNEFWSFSLPFSKYLTTIVPLGVWMIVPALSVAFTHKQNA